MKTYKDGRKRIKTDENGRKLRKRMKTGENDKNRVEKNFFRKTKI